MAENTREIILDTLLALEREKLFSHKLIKDVLDKYNYLEGRDKAFIKRVTEGTIERQIELDYYLNHFSSVPVRKMKPLIRCLLRMSVYQIVYMDAVPDSAVCNEACKLAGKRKFQNLKGFVNGVLRNIAKQKTALPLPDKAKETVRHYSVKYSLPEWLAEMWLAGYGEDCAVKVMEGLMKIHPVSLRFRTKQTDEERTRLVEQIRACGVSLQESRYLPYLYQAENMESIATLPGFEEGAFTVQDTSSALAVEAAGIRENDFVMDICAAPGGKSILAAERAKKVLAGDLTLTKVAVIEENLERMGLTNVETRQHDATVPDEEYFEKADVVLMDVPCSGLGVIGKKRDIKYHVTPESLTEVVKLQKQIIENSWRYVKPGGILLYSTCTVHAQENEEMVRFIVENYPFEPDDVAPYIPRELLRERDMARASMPTAGEDELRNACVQCLPGWMETDGFFFARLRRKE